MTNTNITNFRKNVFEYMEQVVTFGDVVNINTKNGNAIVMNEAEYNSLMETLYLTSMPGMADSIKAGLAEPLEECVDADALEW